MYLNKCLATWFNARRPQKSGMFLINCFTQARSKARILQLIFSLQTTQKGADSVEEYILKMQGIAYHLMAAGQHISEDELILYILGGLGYDFESFVVNLTSRNAITLQEVQYCYTHMKCV